MQSGITLDTQVKIYLKQSGDQSDWFACRSEDILQQNFAFEFQGRSSPPTPPRHRRQLPTRPVSQMILPGGGYMKGMQGTPGMSPLVSGLTLLGSDSPALDKVSGGSPVVRRRAPGRPSGTNVETVAVNVRASMFVPSSFSESTFSSTTSTFGHGPKSKA